MMQPPRQIVAMSPKFRFQLNSVLAAPKKLHPLRVGDDLGRVKSVAHGGDETDRDRR